MRKPATREQLTKLAAVITKEYIVKRAIPERLIEALSGERPPRITTFKVNELTQLQQEILGYASFGLNNTEISEIKFIPTETVKAHMQHIQRALKAKNRTHAVAIALRRGLIN